MKALYSSSQSEERIMGSGGLSKLCCCYCRKSPRDMSKAIAVADMVSIYCHSFVTLMECEYASHDLTHFTFMCLQVIFSFFFLCLMAATIILIICPEVILKIFPFEEDLQNFMKFEGEFCTS